MHAINSSRRRPAPAAGLALAALILLGACAAEPSAPAPCTSLACLKRGAALELRTACLRDLFNYERNRSQQAEIDSRYRYPFVSIENFQNWRRYGGGGPSPQQWCSSFAQRRVYRQPSAVLTFSEK